MKLRIRTPALLLAAELISLAWGSALSAADAIPCERRLALRDVVAYVSLRNVAELRTQWSLTQQGRLAQDEALAEVRGELESKFAEASKEIEKEYGLSLTDLLNMPQGEVAVALSVSPAGKPTPLLMLDFGEKEETLHKLIEKLARGKDEGWESTSTEFDDTKLIQFQPKGGTQEPGARPKPGDREAGRPGRPQPTVAVVGGFAYFVRDTFLVVGGDTDSLKAVLRRWDGKHENVLAENPVYRYIADRCRDPGAGRRALLTWFIDPITLTRTVLSAQENAPPQLGMAMALLPLLGIDRFKGVGGTLDLARGEFDMVSRSLVLSQQPVAGLLNVASFDAAMAPPPWVTSQASSYFSIQWNVGKAYGGIETLADLVQGPGTLARLVDQLAAEESFGGLHLKKDVIDALTGRIHVVGETTGSGEDEEVNSIVALELKNAQAMKGTLAKLARIPGAPVEVREFQGETLYEIDASSFGAGEASIGIVVTQNHLMVGTDVKLIERVLRGTEGTEPLADTAAYKRIARRYPERTAAIGYDREEDPLQSLMDIVERLASSPLIGADVSALVAKLPSAELALKKYKSSSGSYMQPDERGFRFTSFTLKKEAE